MLDSNRVLDNTTSIYNRWKDIDWSTIKLSIMLYATKLEYLGPKSNSRT